MFKFFVCQKNKTKKITIEIFKKLKLFSSSKERTKNPGIKFEGRREKEKKDKKNWSSKLYEHHMSSKKEANQEKKKGMEKKETTD